MKVPLKSNWCVVIVSLLTQNIYFKANQKTVTLIYTWYCPTIKCQSLSSLPHCWKSDKVLWSTKPFWNCTTIKVVIFSSTTKKLMGTCFKKAIKQQTKNITNIKWLLTAPPLQPSPRKPRDPELIGQKRCLHSWRLYTHFRQGAC